MKQKKDLGLRNFEPRMEEENKERDPWFFEGKREKKMMHFC